MNTIEGNKLIAEFDGKIKDADSPWWEGFDVMIHGQPSAHSEQLKYHSSWDWLMPVIEKIEALGFEVTLQSYQCQIFDNSKKYPDSWIIDADFKDAKLENAWDGVIGFIEWYNKQQSVKESDTTKAT